jgi:Calcineurin-like phosphoesterase
MDQEFWTKYSSFKLLRQSYPFFVSKVQEQGFKISIMQRIESDINMDDGSSKKRKSKSKAKIEERDAQIAALQKQITHLTNLLAAKNSKRRHHPLEPHAVKIHETPVGSNSLNQRVVLSSMRERIGRNASITTQNVLNKLPDTNNDSHSQLAERVIEMFKNPAAHMDYLNGQQFAKDLIKLNHKVKAILEREPRVTFIQSPAYVFGDIHGNLEDLHFFSDNMWRLGMSLVAGNFLFLGDYVDRGMSCLECVAYLLAMKLLLPHKVFLLRGNHETRDVNGWEEHYGERSFIYQCRARFGDDLGYRIWEQTNQVFDRMPLAAVIDQDIFCVHGGIPRPIGAGETRIQDILSVPKVAGINPPYEHEDDDYQQVASDCIWSDPASEEQELLSVDPDTGFGESLRGGGAIW